MKFLVFNLIVAVALIYLFSDKEGGINAIGEKTFDVVDSIKSKTESIASSTIKEQAPAPKVPPPLIPQANIVLESAKPVSVPVLPIPKIQPFELDPIISGRRDEIMETSSKPTPGPEDNAFMTRQERRQALMKLAEDMEYFSAEAISQ
jgi:hypothetical protein